MTHYEQGKQYAREILSGAAPEIEREGILEGIAEQLRKGACREVIIAQQVTLYSRIYGASLDRAKAFVRGFWEVAEPHLPRFRHGLGATT